MSDSLKIAEYLDATYPERNTVLVPAGTSGLQRAFMETVYEITSRWMSPLLIPRMLGSGGSTKVLSERSAKYFAGLVGPMASLPQLEGKELEEKWATAEKEMEKIASWYDGDSLFISGGEEPCFADFAIAAVFVTQRSLWGTKSEEWSQMRSWNGGRWGRLVDALKSYESTKDFDPKSH